MDEVLTIIFDSLESNINSESKKRVIYESVAEHLLMYDENMANELAKEYDLFSDVILEMLGDESLEDE